MQAWWLQSVCAGTVLQCLMRGCGSRLQVLAEAGAAGLSTVEIARRIQAAGLRDLRTCKAPEVQPVLGRASQLPS